MSVKNLHFTISGEFITNIARTWFWDENRPYEKSEELLFCCLGSEEIDDDQRRRIAQDIIEGRKKLVGDNVVEVVDDNENVRPIILKIKELEKENGIKEIELRMETWPYTFVDPYSTLKSKRAFEELELYEEYDGSPYQKCYEFFCHDRFGHEYEEASSRTKCGLWLLNEPRTAWEATKGLTVAVDTDDFWKNIYELTKGRTDPAFVDRTRRYEAEMRAFGREEKGYAEFHTDALKAAEDEVNQEEAGTIWNMAARVRLDIVDKGYGDRWLDGAVIPDDMLKFTGLIAPNGDFYSCSFGGHESKAYNIITNNHERFGMNEDGKINGREVERDNALDFLIEAGWIATRFLPYSGNYLTVGDRKRPTKAQIDRVYDLIVKHGMTPNNLYLLEDN